MASHSYMRQSDLVTQIIANLDAAPPLAIRERRDQVRVRFRTVIEAIMLNGALPATIRIATRNISRAGLSFVLRRPLTPGMRVAVPLKVEGQPGKLVLLRITFNRYLREGIYEAGGEFEAATVASEPPHVPEEWYHVSQKWALSLGARADA